MAHPRLACECSDKLCPAHPGRDCSDLQTTVLHRSDMQDESGVAFCEPCASDALDSGVFSIENAEYEEDEDNIPPCAAIMGCLCAWHAVGAPADEPCDADEKRARERIEDE